MDLYKLRLTPQSALTKRDNMRRLKFTPYGNRPQFLACIVQSLSAAAEARIRTSPPPTRKAAAVLGNNRGPHLRLTHLANQGELPEITVPLDRERIIVNGHHAPADKDGKIWVRACAKVQSEPESLYALRRAVERAPKWQAQIVELRKTGERTSHWGMRSGDDRIERGSEIVNDEPWRSTRTFWANLPVSL